MLWLLPALLSRLCFAGCNIFASHFRDYFSTGYAQLFYGALYAFALLPLLFLVVQPVMPLSGEWPWLALSGILTSAYVIPYFAALRVADTSVVASLFVFSRVLTPFIAYILIRETLSVHEWVGFLITIPGGLLASYSPNHKKKFNFSVLGLMGLASIGFALSMIIGKMAFNRISGLDGFCYIYLFSTLTSCSFILIPAFRTSILDGVRATKPVRKIFLLLPVMSLFGNLFLFVSLSMTKASLVIMVGQAQAFFVLLITLLIQKRGWINTQENLDPKTVFQKTSAFMVMTIGVAITLFGGG